MLSWETRVHLFHVCPATGALNKRPAGGQPSSLQGPAQNSKSEYSWPKHRPPLTKSPQEHHLTEPLSPSMANQHVHKGDERLHAHSQQWWCGIQAKTQDVATAS